MRRSYMIAARRSPIAPRGGALHALALHELATPVIAQVLADAGIGPDRVEEIIVSNALGGGGNPARVVALAAGLPEHVAGLSIDRQCVGGLDAVLLADMMVRSGQHDIVLAGGVESYSRRPLRLRSFADGRAPEPYDQAAFTPWPERDPDMATAAEDLAKHLNINRAAQDAWSVESHAKARACPPEFHQAEIVPLAGLTQDSFTRTLTGRLCARAPVIHGSITAANMAVAADGAGFVLVVSEAVAAALMCPAVELLAGRTLGGTPDLPGLAPVAAIGAVLDQATTLVTAEIMEAFAVQAIACQTGAGLPVEIVNQYGGALARGHPVGASGAVLAVRLYHQLCRTPGSGLAAIAAAGGLGTALLARRL